MKVLRSDLKSECTGDAFVFADESSRGNESSGLHESMMNTD